MQEGEKEIPPLPPLSISTSLALHQKKINQTKHKRSKSIKTETMISILTDIQKKSKQDIAIHNIGWYNDCLRFRT